MIRREYPTRRCHHCGRQSWRVAQGEMCQWCGRKTSKYNHMLFHTIAIIAVVAMIVTAVRLA